MSREPPVSLPLQLQTSNSVGHDGIELQHGNDPIAVASEDTNNNTSLVDREQGHEGSSIEGNSSSSRQSPSVREIHKNSWLKRMPCGEKWPGRFPKSQKPEKFWVVFCVHDEKDAFLEFYENRRSAYAHTPLSNISLSKCLHISPTIVAQENDFEFVITLETQVIRLAASTNEQMLEWMVTMRTKLRELNILEPKDNLYSKEPITSMRPGSVSAGTSSDPLNREDFSRLSLRDPNSPLPPVPGSVSSHSEARENPLPNSSVVFVRNPSILHVTMQTSCQPSVNNSIESNSDLRPDLMFPPVRSEPEFFDFDVLTDSEQSVRRVSRSSSLVSQDSSSPVSSPGCVDQRMSSIPDNPILEQTSLYEPLFYSPPSSLNLGIRNPNYENPPQPQRQVVSNPTPALHQRPVNNQRRMSSSVASDIQSVHCDVKTSNLSNFTSASDPSLNASSASGSSSTTVELSSHSVMNSVPILLSRTQSHHDSVQSVSERSPNLPLEEGPPPYNGMGLRSQLANALNSNSVPVDENGKLLSLRQFQVQKLQSEMLHKSGVRLVLRKKDCVNAIALVECFNSVWVAGWKQKEHPLLHNTFHVGDCIISVAGHRILSMQDAHKAIKHQPSIVEFIVKRVPFGKVLAIKREYEGQDLGIVREGGTAEIREVGQNGLASQYGLSAKASTLDGNSLCNWFLTEINHRPLNLFFKDNEVQDRLNAVGLDISILVQPSDLVKVLKKQLKALRSYKDYIVQ